MGFGQRLSAIRRIGSFEKKVRQTEKDSIKTMNGVDMMNDSDTSTGGMGSIDSLDSLEMGNANFPLNITEYINHSACYITIDTTRNCTRLIEHEESITNIILSGNESVKGKNSQEAILDEGEEYEYEGADIKEMNDKNECVVEDVFTRTLRSRERMDMTINSVKTSIDCVLDDVVLTLDRENIFPELTYLTAPLIGRWETSLEMSDPLDPLFKACGINYVKRFVVDKLPLVIDLSYSDDQKHFQLNLQIPFGNRLMKWDLYGQTYVDNDPDCGLWDGHVTIQKAFFNDVCPTNSKSSEIFNEIVSEIRQDKINDAKIHISETNDSTEEDFIYVPCQIREHATIGVVHESRFTLPSKKYGKVLFLKYVLFPKNSKKQVVVMRCLRPQQA